MNMIDLIDHMTGPIEVGFSSPALYESGVCEDDCEFTACLMLPLPEETSKEEPSPLRFEVVTAEPVNTRSTHMARVQARKRTQEQKRAARLAKLHAAQFPRF